MPSLHLPLLRSLILFLLAALGPAALRADAAPELRFVHAPELAGAAERLAAYDHDALRRTAELVGLADAGEPIPVHLVLEGSGAARLAPSWGLAYARGGQVVIIPSRVPGYPYGRLETVLHHEVAHVLIQRAAAGGPVPRWFHEGLALYAARDWGLADRSRILWATWRGQESALAVLDRRFAAGADAAGRAYAFSAAFVRYLIDRHGGRTPARVLAGTAAGASFEDAFLDATGVTLAEAELAFFRNLDLWNKWVPFVTSSTTLWIVVTFLALWAFRRRRRRDAEIKARWDAEDAWWDGEVN
ncbi:MAG TPA: hypothetical protein VGG06_18195 [Thermoanaerobaculia bacterium]|jgi:hypothetical protein